MKLNLDNYHLSQVEFRKSLGCLELALDSLPSSSACHVDFAHSADLVVTVSFLPNICVSKSDLDILFRMLRREFKVTSYYFDTYVSANRSFLYFVLFLDFKDYE